MGAINGIDFGTSVFINLIPVVIVFMCSIAITRNVNKIKVLQLPIAIGMSAIGVWTGYIPLIIYTILYVTATFDLSNLGDYISSTTERLGRSFKKDKEMEQKRIEFDETFR